MKRIVDGLRYDTATATELVAWNNGAFGNDFNRCREVLYRTKTGRYFIHGEGGPMSRWAEACEGGRSVCNGEGIRTLTPKAALTWLEEHGEDIPDGCPELAALVVDA